MRGIIQDITERKLSEIQLRDSEERYRATFEQAAVGIVHTSFEGTVLRCNPRFAEIVGYSPEEIPGMTVQQLTAPEDIGSGGSVGQRRALPHRIPDESRSSRYQPFGRWDIYRCQ